MPFTDEIVTFIVLSFDWILNGCFLPPRNNESFLMVFLLALTRALYRCDCYFYCTFFWLDFEWLFPASYFFFFYRYKESFLVVFLLALTRTLYRCDLLSIDSILYCWFNFRSLWSAMEGLLSCLFEIRRFFSGYTPSSAGYSCSLLIEYIVIWPYIIKFTVSHVLGPFDLLINCLYVASYRSQVSSDYILLRFQILKLFSVSLW